MPQPEPQTQSQLYFTNSLLQLQIPPSLQSQPYSIQWLTRPNAKFNNNFILTRFEGNRMGRSLEFQCTPLEYGAVVVGRVMVMRDGDQQVVREREFGPIRVEKYMGMFMDEQQPLQVKIIPHKNITLTGTLQLLANPSHSPTLTLKSPHLTLQIKIDQSIRLPSNNSFFKFYEKEEQSLGISVYHQHEELVDKMRELGHIGHIGFYVKIGFSGRVDRDGFLYRVMKEMGVRFQEFQGGHSKQESKQYIISIKQSKAPKPDSPNPHPISQTKRRNTKEIDEEILKLLHDESIMNGNNELSLDMAEAELLLASSKKIELSNKSLMKESDVQNYQFQNRASLLMEKNQNRPERKMVRVLDQGLTSREAEDPKSKSSRKMSHFGSVTRPFEPEDNNENYLRSTISKLREQVHSLLKQNRKLVQQNKRLKDQNMRLRLKQIKNTSISRVQEVNSNSNKCVSKEKVNNVKGKDRSGSISPLVHQKRHTIYPSRNNSAISINNNSVKQMCSTLHQKSKETRQIKLTSSSGSILLSSGQVKNVNNPPLNSASTKDLIRQFEPEPKIRTAGTEKIPYFYASHHQQQIAHGPDGKNIAHSHQNLSYLKSSSFKTIPNFGFSSVQFTNNGATFRR